MSWATLIEYPIRTDSCIYDGGCTKAIPDRVVLSAVQYEPNKWVLAFRGLMRHGPENNFISASPELDIWKHIRIWKIHIVLLVGLLARYLLSRNVEHLDQ
jgi:hypothetical protein